MCTYNGARYVREQLESIATQTRPPDELIVCDDGSIDQTADTVTAFARTASFPVRLQVNETNLGSTKNFEQALKICKGDLIAFSDQDDVWLPEKLSQLERALENGAALAFTNGEVVDDSLKPLGRSVWDTLGFSAKEQETFRQGRAFDVLLDHNVATGAAMAFRADFKDLILPIPDNLIHDGVPVLHDWWAALLVAAVSKISFIAEQLLKYRQHERQQMGVYGALEPSSAMTAKEPFREAAVRRNSFASEINYFDALHERLSSRPGFRARAEILEELQQRVEHLTTRARLPEARLQRIGPIVRELFKRRYDRYSNGLFSAGKDFWFQPTPEVAANKSRNT